jgi:hypothetical protein
MSDRIRDDQWLDPPEEWLDLPSVWEQVKNSVWEQVNYE